MRNYMYMTKQCFCFFICLYFFPCGFAEGITTGGFNLPRLKQEEKISPKECFHNKEKKETTGSSAIFSSDKDEEHIARAAPPETGDGQKLTDEDPPSPLPLYAHDRSTLLLFSLVWIVLYMRKKYKFKVG